jgi:GNAT superfamily N-acetyltransferase
MWTLTVGVANSSHMEHISTLYEGLRGWQTGIGSLIGFVALISGALWNFRLNRRRDAALRREEMLSVAVALYGEILLLRGEAAKLAHIVAAREYQGRGFDRQFVEERKLSEPILYPALAPKIGLLPPDLVIAITAFHKNFQEARESISFLVDDDERKYGYGASWVLSPAVAAVNGIKPMLRVVEKLAKIPPVADPDLGMAEDILEIEHEMHATPPPG